MKRHARKILQTLLICSLLSPMLGVAPVLAQFDRPQGIKTVIVLSAFYSGTTGPALNDAQWAGVYGAALTPYFRAATTDTLDGALRSRLTLRFAAGSSFGGPTSYLLPVPAPPVPAPGSDAPYDPTLLFKEGLAALMQFDAANPDLMLNPDRRLFVIMVNSPVRGQATVVYPFKTSKGQMVNLAVSVFSEVPGSTLVGPSTTVTVPQLDPSGAPAVEANGTPIRDIDSETIAVGGHELGHTLGLPDLYSEDKTIPEFVGQWCPMAENRQNNFSGWARALQAWLPRDKIFVPVMPPPGVTLDRTVNLFPPRTTTSSGFELIMIPTNEELRNWSPTVDSWVRMFGLTGPGGPHFTGFIIEHRRFIGLDSPVTTGVDGTGVTRNLNLTLGLKEDSEQGLVVSFAKPWLPIAKWPPINPLNVVHVPTGDSLENAAFSSAEFIDTNSGIRITPQGLNADGSMRVRIRWTVPPRPELAVKDTWIDSPGNGFGTFLLGGSATAATPPYGPGDAVFVPLTVEWRSGWFDIPYPVVVSSPVNHLVQIRVRNSGLIPITRIRGRLVIIEPQMLPLNLINPADVPGSLFALLQALNPVRIIDLDSASTPFTVIGGGGPTLNPGQEANFSVSYTPRREFVGIAVLNLVDGAPTGIMGSQQEPLETMFNNWAFEPYIVVTSIPGSPYSPVSLEIPLSNANRDSRVFMPALDGTGNGDPSQPGTWWRTSLKPAFEQLDPQGSTTLKAQIRPPDPPDYKPTAVELGLTAWMNYNDAMIPVCRLPFTVLTRLETKLTLAIDGKGNLSGKLTAKQMDGSSTRAPRGSQIILNWSSSDGQMKQLLPEDPGYQATTNRFGDYSQENLWIQMSEGVRYVANAEFVGKDEFAASRSEPAILDVSDNSGRPDLVVRVSGSQGTGLLRLANRIATLTSIARSLPPDIERLLLFGSDRQRGQVRLVVTNLGQQRAAASRVRIFSSRHDYLGEGAREVGFASVPPIPVGGSVVVRATVDLQRLREQGYMLLMADATRSVAEANENNNLRVFRLSN